jgi:hypothetical protein
VSSTEPTKDSGGGGVALRLYFKTVSSKVVVAEWR